MPFGFGHTNQLGLCYVVLCYVRRLYSRELSVI